jgi:hypothetical protein
MKPTRLPRIFAVMSVALAATGADKSPGAYSPAVFAENQAREPRLDVFPIDGKVFSIPTPGLPGWVVYAPDGRTVYSTALNRPGVFKIGLKPFQISTLPGSTELGFAGIGSLTISKQQDKILFSASKRYGRGFTYGIFELSLSDGNLRSILLDSNCGTDPTGGRTSGAWGSLSLAPDGQRAVGLCGPGLELIDLVQGTSRLLGKALWKGAWSPDGKWIAALQLDGRPALSRTVLVDPNDSSHRRDLGGVSDTEIVWSPDSRYILHCFWRPCGITFETIDIETSKRTVLKNSQCKVGLSRQIGWVRTDLGE